MVSATTVLPRISPTSWLKYPTVTPRSTETRPSSGCSSFVIRRKRVDFPAPLGPTRPTCSPRCTTALASRKRICWPCCLATESSRIMGGAVDNTPRHPGSSRASAFHLRGRRAPDLHRSDAQVDELHGVHARGGDRHVQA